MAADRALTKRELLKELGITDRLLKFWMGWYKLPLNRRGRGSTYPFQTVETLRIIKRLSDSRYFTMRFVRELLLGTQGADAEKLQSHLSLCRSILTRSAIPERSYPSSTTVIRASHRPAAAEEPPRALAMSADLL